MRLALPSTICPWSFSVIPVTNHQARITDTFSSIAPHTHRFRYYSPWIVSAPVPCPTCVRWSRKKWWTSAVLQPRLEAMVPWEADGKLPLFLIYMAFWWSAWLIWWSDGEVKRGCSQLMVNYPDYLVVLIMVLRMDWLMLTLISHTLSGNYRNRNWNIHHS